MFGCASRFDCGRLTDELVCLLAGLPNEGVIDVRFVVVVLFAFVVLAQQKCERGFNCRSLSFRTIYPIIAFQYQMIKSMSCSHLMRHTMTSPKRSCQFSASTVAMRGNKFRKVTNLEWKASKQTKAK